jgi:hypothetical protein
MLTTQKLVMLGVGGACLGWLAINWIPVLFNPSGTKIGMDATQWLINIIALVVGIVLIYLGLR